MGQYESKQKLEKVRQSVEKIRKDVRNGKITANDVERIQGYLRQYSNEIDTNKNVKLRKSDVYTLEQLIEITSKELDAVKDEVNLDSAAIHTNSFSRASTKNYSKQKRNSVKSIAKAVEDIRTQIRNGQVQNPEQLQADLVNYSQELSSKKGKKQEIDKVQKLVSSVTQELFSKQLNETPDNVSIRSSTNSLSRKTGSTNSLTRKNENTNSLSRRSEKRSSSIKEQEIRKETPKISSRNTNTFDDIETKLDVLKNDVQVAETNKDKSRLRFLSKSVQTLMTDLQMVNLKNKVLDEERRELLEKNLQRLYQQIEKVKRQISTESNINYLVELEKKQKRERYIQDLDNLQKTLKDVSANLNSQNYQAEKENFVIYKNKVDSVEDVDQEITMKKAEISNSLLDLENALTRLEMEDRLNQAEWRHCQYKIDLKKFPLTTKHEAYKKHKQYLTQLREYIDKIQEINQKVDEKKKYVLYNIDNNIAALEKKALENEEKQNKEKGDTPSDKLIIACNQIPTSGSPEEIKNLLPLLTKAKTIIEQKINSIQYQKQQEDSETVLVRIKEREIEPDFKNLAYAIDNVQKEVSNLPSENNAKIVILDEDIIDKNPEDITVLEIIKKPEDDQANAQLEKIQNELEALYVRIKNQRYTKETQFYKEARNELQNYKNQIEGISVDGNEKLKENCLKFVDDTLQHLENNLASRRSTTEDILVDIMSVSTRVAELGNKIQNCGQTAEGYESIRSSLQEHRDYLRKLPITPNRLNLYKSREEIFQQIDKHLAKIEELKKNDNDNSGSEEEKRFSQDLRKLKEKVSRYSGTYKNVLYRTIENDLDKHLNRVDKVFKDQDVVLKVKKDIENSKMILEQKSNKDQNYNQVKRNVPEPGSKQLTEIKQNIETVEKAMNRNRPLTKDELDKLDATLTLSILALDNIKDEKHSKEKEKLYQEIHYYFDQLQELMVVNKSHSRLVKNPQEKEMSEEQQLAITVASIEQDLEKIKPDILAFVGTETSPNFLHLDEILVRGTLKLDELNIDPASELYPLKKKLMREIHKYSDILDERINQTEEIEKLEKDVNVMLIKIDSFNGYFGDPEYQLLDEQIIKLKVSLGKLHVNQELIDRRDACIRDVDSCMKKLKEAAKPRHDAFGGTLV